jgi:hypothetical protein
MKLKIEVELEPEEVPLATELLSILREITQHLQVTKKGANSSVEIFRSLIEQLVDPAQLESVSSSLNAIFDQNPAVRLTQKTIYAPFLVVSDQGCLVC